MSAQSPHETAAALVNLLQDHGQSDYIGEPISQLEHSLQCADLASTNGAGPETIIAALLHDIGQFLPEDQVEQLAGQVQNMRDSNSSASSTTSSDDGSGMRHPDSGSVGRVGHEDIGAMYLSSLGFSPKVCALVAAHVPAKRYLCAVEEQYYDGLSDASKRSLQLQGGPMSGLELEEWAKGEWSGEMCRLRKWDDAAKIVGYTVPPVSAYERLIEEHLMSHAEVVA